MDTNPAALARFDGNPLLQLGTASEPLQVILGNLDEEDQQGLICAIYSELDSLERGEQRRSTAGAGGGPGPSTAPPTSTWLHVELPAEAPTLMDMVQGLGSNVNNIRSLVVTITTLDGTTVPAFAYLCHQLPWLEELELAGSDDILHVQLMDVLEEGIPYLRALTRLKLPPMGLRTTAEAWAPCVAELARLDQPPMGVSIHGSPIMAVAAIEAMLRTGYYGCLRVPLGEHFALLSASLPGATTLRSMVLASFRPAEPAAPGLYGLAGPTWPVPSDLSAMPEVTDVTCVAHWSDVPRILDAFSMVKRLALLVRFTRDPKELNRGLTSAPAEQQKVVLEALRAREGLEAVALAGFYSPDGATVVPASIDAGQMAACLKDHPAQCLFLDGSTSLDCFTHAWPQQRNRFLAAPNLDPVSSGPEQGYYLEPALFASCPQPAFVRMTNICGVLDPFGLARAWQRVVRLDLSGSYQLGLEGNMCRFPSVSSQSLEHLKITNMVIRDTHAHPCLLDGLKTLTVTYNLWPGTTAAILAWSLLRDAPHFSFKQLVFAAPGGGNGGDLAGHPLRLTARRCMSGVWAESFGHLLHLAGQQATHAGGQLDATGPLQTLAADVALEYDAAHNLLTLFKKVLCKGTMPQDLVGLLFVELDRQRSERLRLAKSTLLERARAAVAEGARFSGGSPAGDALLRLAAERAGGGRGAPVVKGGGGGAGVAGAAGGGAGGGGGAGVHSLQQLPRGPGNGAAPQLLFGAVDTWAPSTFVPAPGALVAPGAFGAVLAPGSGGVAPGMVPSRLCSDERTQHHNAGVQPYGYGTEPQKLPGYQGQVSRERLWQQLQALLQQPLMAGTATPNVVAGVAPAMATGLSQAVQGQVAPGPAAAGGAAAAGPMGHSPSGVEGNRGTVGGSRPAGATNDAAGAAGVLGNEATAATAAAAGPSNVAGGAVSTGAQRAMNACSEAAARAGLAASMPELEGSPDGAPLLQLHFLLRNRSEQERKQGVRALLQGASPPLQGASPPVPPRKLASYGRLECQLLRKYGAHLLGFIKAQQVCQGPDGQTPSCLYHGLHNSLPTLTKLSQLQGPGGYLLAMTSGVADDINDSSGKDYVGIKVVVAPYMVPEGEVADTFAGLVQTALTEAQECPVMRVEEGSLDRQRLGQLFQAAPTVEWMLAEKKIHTMLFIGPWTSTEEIEQLVGVAAAYGVVQLAPTGQVRRQPRQAADPNQAQPSDAMAVWNGLTYVRLADRALLDHRGQAIDLALTSEEEVKTLTQLLTWMRKWPVQALDMGAAAGEEAAHARYAVPEGVKARREADDQAKQQLCVICKNNSLQVEEFYTSMAELLLPRGPLLGELPSFIFLKHDLLSRSGQALVSCMAGIWGQKKQDKKQQQGGQRVKGMQSAPRVDAHRVPFQELRRQLGAGLQVLSKYYHHQQDLVVAISTKWTADGLMFVVTVVVGPRWVHAAHQPLWQRRMQAALDAVPSPGDDNWLDVAATAALREEYGQLFKPMQPVGELLRKGKVTSAHFVGPCGNLQELVQLAEAVSAYVPAQVPANAEPVATADGGAATYVNDAAKAAVKAASQQGAASSSSAPIPQMVDLGHWFNAWRPLCSGEVGFHKELLAAVRQHPPQSLWNPPARPASTARSNVSGFSRLRVGDKPK